jgi:hypothetical protein
MPKTAMDEYDFAATSEDQIGLAGKLRAVKAEAVADGVDEAANLNLCLPTLTLNAGHPLASLILAQGIQSVSRGPNGCPADP